MFQFSGFALLSEWCIFNASGCPIQVSPDQLVCADPRGFSQLITPFFASESLGIPHTPLFCLLYFFSGIGFWVMGFGLPQYLRPNSQHLQLCSFYFLNIFLSQYVNELFPSLQYSVFSRQWTAPWPPQADHSNRGEYRSRTDDPLRARQAL